ARPDDDFVPAVAEAESLVSEACMSAALEPARGIAQDAQPQDNVILLVQRRQRRLLKGRHGRSGREDSAASSTADLSAEVVIGQLQQPTASGTAQLDWHGSSLAGL